MSGGRMQRGRHTSRRRRILGGVTRILAVIGLLILSVVMCALSVLLMVWFMLKLLP